MRLAKGRKTILFAPRVVDAERFAEEFKAAGVAAEAVSGYMDTMDCIESVERFRRSEIMVICSVSKLATGFSVKDVGCIIDAQPTQSLMRHRQKLGRGLRIHPDKENVIILDNAGNLIRNGLPDGKYPTELNNGDEASTDKRDKNDPQPTECPKCHAVKPPKISICPQCEYETKRQSELEVEAGELVDMRGKEAPAKKSKEEKLSMPEKAKLYGGLLHYARGKGYKDGWAANQYKTQTGVWPKGLNADPRIPPDDGLLSWIKSRQIRWAKRKDK